MENLVPGQHHHVSREAVCGNGTQHVQALVYLPRPQTMPFTWAAVCNCPSIAFQMNEKIIPGVVEPIPPPVGRVFPVAEWIS